MIEPNELVNLIASFFLFLYLFKLIRNGKCTQMPGEWLLGMLFLVISNIFTVAEGFLLPVLFNTIEHLANLSAAVIFLIGALKIKIS